MISYSNAGCEVGRLALYLFLWYLGPANRLSAIDFMGVSGPLLPSRTALTFLMITAALAVFALFGRQRQLTR